MLVHLISLSDLTVRFLNHLMKYHQFIYHLLIGSFRYESLGRKSGETENIRSFWKSIQFFSKSIRSFSERYAAFQPNAKGNGP